ncbi:crossover junction endodeoxyribonuclease RuvC [Mesosutterella sp. AGMB02718]|uniref:Crossover junction endodeoxyribonuclease RuvC n=1 Tax=Mesosutterella faecium TaxID=2925194 RepID=A0ABT7IJR9_9BURK|nr:crossover junction endodeoxyribonuclease RuvC [Mesosutterella sp. AGMB02718]MDL2058618.1 crossover junction endodeoxyribonuclease RuvC [Mesosutterella sp. AGMB02718]
MRILGIDPGLNRTGFGVIDAAAGEPRLVTAGVIRVPKSELAQRLAVIYRRLQEIIAETGPDMAACEKVFVNVNPNSTLLLGQARGAALASAACAGLRVAEFTPTEIKQAVTGSGRAQKSQIRAMMVMVFSLPETPQADAADALACALCAAQAARMVEAAGASKTSIGAARSTSCGGARAARRAWTQKITGMEERKP